MKLTIVQDVAFKRISVIIANYNYDRFVGRAIQSALELDWPDVEVIVVDDGSTDSSRDVISTYEDRIRVLFQENSTQRVARNRGFAMSTGDVIIHLDSDDVLDPALPRELEKVWRPGISKVQFQMRRIDENDRTVGTLFPKYRHAPTPQEIRRWAARTSAYPTPPGSGNAYSREFLERIFPLDDSCGPATDSACLAVAPFLGDVITVAKPLVGYRVHGGNVSNMLADDTKFPRAVERARARYLYTRRVVDGNEGRVDERPLFRSRPLLQLRVASARLRPEERPLPGDSRLRMLRDAVTAPSHPGPESLLQRILISGWSLVTLLAPIGLARRLVRMRYGQQR